MSQSKGDKIYRWHRQSKSTTTQVVPVEAKNGSVSQPADVTSRTEGLPRRWFCVAVSSSGDIVKQETESLAELLGMCKNSTLAWIDFWTDDLEKDAPRVASELGFSTRLTSSLFGEYLVTYQDFDAELGMRFPSIQVLVSEVRTSPLVLLLKKNFVLTMHPLSVDRRFTRLRRYSDTVLRRIPVDGSTEDKLTLLLLRIIDENNDRNFEELRKIEERGDDLSHNLTDPKTPRSKLGLEIYRMKHDLIAYLDALWATVDVLHSLRYGDAELISNNPELLNRLNILAEDVNRQIELAEHMSEVLASGLEVLQSIYNNQLQALNNRLAMVMTYLTILGTAVLVPNTLATILGNSAFNLGREDIGWYVTLLVVSTIVATFLAYWWVKKKGWLPKSPD